MNTTAPALLETFSQGKKGVIKVITTFQCVHVCNNRNQILETCLSQTYNKLLYYYMTVI
jgi:hypothetical protein